MVAGLKAGFRAVEPEKTNASYVSRVPRLTLLAPDIVKQSLDGRQPAAMTLPSLVEPFSVEWEGPW